MLTFMISSAGTTGTEEPPGITAFNLRPFHTPPAISNRSRNGTPIGSSKLPGLLTWPDTEKILVPPAFFGPRPANHCAPLRRIAGTDAKLWVLLMVVGLP